MLSAAVVDPNVGLKVIVVPDRYVNRAVNTRNLRAVEEIERLAQNLELRSFGNLEPARKAQVNVPDVRLLEGVARQTGKAVGAARAVGAAARRGAGRVRHQAKCRRLVGVIPPLIKPVTRAPENALRIGAIVQPLKMCPAALVS